MNDSTRTSAPVTGEQETYYEVEIGRNSLAGFTGKLFRVSGTEREEIGPVHGLFMGREGVIRAAKAQVRELLAKPEIVRIDLDDDGGVAA
ncbi:MAG: hypothetical protein ACRDK4_04915 [Solirubrobacteraceae bacterium]